MLWHGKNFRGFLNKAKEVILNNTGTTLTSTNVEDAIKEVNSNLMKQTYTELARNNSTTSVTLTIDESKYNYLGLARSVDSSDSRLFNPIMLPIAVVKTCGSMILHYNSSVNSEDYIFKIIYSSGSWMLSCDGNYAGFYGVAFVL